MVAASIYASIRVHGISRTIKEIEELTGIWRRIFIRFLRRLVMDVLPILGMRLQFCGPEHWIENLRQELGLPMACRKFAISLLKILTLKNITFSGKDPKGIAAGLLYLSAKSASIHVTQRVVAEKARITEVTLRKRVNEYKSYVSLIK